MVAFRQFRHAEAGIWGAADFGFPPNVSWADESAFGAHSFGNSRSGGQAGVVPVSCVSSVRQLTITGDVRLHNRSDLIRLLGLAPSFLQHPDIFLLLCAYEKWGEECARFLVGEFAFAIWDEKHQQLFCCRDHMGFRPFLYWSSGSRFLFASDPRAILAVPCVPRELNRRKLAGMAISSGCELHDEDTFHQGIQSLPYGCSLIVSREGIRKRRYWEPEIRSELVPRRPEQVIEALRELLFEAVECRISDGTPFAVELSGGLDSSAIAAVAARYLQKKGKTLLALAGVLPAESLAEHSDEREFIDEFRSVSNVRIEYVTAAGRGPFDTIGDPAHFEVSPIRASSFYLHDAFKEVAVANGARLQLRGLLGELGPSCTAHRYFVELAVKFQWPTLVKHLLALRRVEGIRPLRYLGGRFLDLWRRPPAERENLYVMLTPEFRRYGKALRPFSCASPYQRQFQLAQTRRFLRAHATWRGRSVEDGTRFSHPWLDKRVIEFCLAVPPDLKLQNGYHRYLIRAALEGVLPKRIQWRTDKTPFSPDYFVRYNAQLKIAREFVRAIGPSDPIRSAIDVTQLTQLLRPVDTRAVSTIARSVVPANFYTICFLRQFSEFRP